MSIINKLKGWFAKDDLENQPKIDTDDRATFILTIDNIQVGILSCKDSVWHFEYSQEFKSYSDQYYPIVGFPDLEREYRSHSLWPFFLIRIPGLKQPAVQKIVKEKAINPASEVELLRAFGQRTIANPFELTYCQA